MVKKSTKKTSKRSTRSVSYEPNKMSFAVALLGAVTLVLFAVIATQA